MKKTLTVLILATSAFSAQAEGYVTLSRAKSGDTSYSFGVGGDRWGAQFGVINDSDFTSDQVHDYKVPHGNFITTGEYQVGNTMGLDITYKLWKTEAVAITIGGGLYRENTKLIARFNATGRYYAQEDRSRMIAPLSVKLTMKPVPAHSNLIIGVEYHTLRGASILIGAGLL